MTRKKAKTLIERMGFLDEDLSTPRHDAIMLWLHENIQDLLNIHVRNGKRVEYKDAEGRYGFEFLFDGAPPSRLPIIKKIVWEDVIFSGESIAGFVDMRVDFYHEGNVLGVFDKNVFTNGCNSINDFYLNFEVKPSIKSIGELLRQLQFYYTHGAKNLIVVSPDSRFRGLILDQGFGFLECPKA